MKKIRFGVYETNSSSTHSLVIISKEEYESFVNGKMVLDLYSGTAQPLDEEKIFITNEDGSISYNGKKYDDKYDFYEDEYKDFGDDYATKDYLDMFADVEQKELDNNVIMSVYRSERW